MGSVNACGKTAGRSSNAAGQLGVDLRTGGQVSQFLDGAGVQDVAAHHSALEHQQWLGLGEVGERLGGRTDVGGHEGHGGRSDQQFGQVPVEFVGCATHQRVLVHLVHGAGLGQRSPKALQFLDRQSAVLGENHRLGVAHPLLHLGHHGHFVGPGFLGVGLGCKFCGVICHALTPPLFILVGSKPGWLWVEIATRTTSETRNGCPQADTRTREAAPEGVTRSEESAYFGEPRLIEELPAGAGLSTEGLWRCDLEDESLADPPTWSRRRRRRHGQRGPWWRTATPSSGTCPWTPTAWPA